MLALSFPEFGHPACGWIALAPLLVALAGPLNNVGMRRSFALGLTTGVTYFAGTLYWITHVMAVYGGLATGVAALVNAALVAYLALFPAIFAMTMRRALVAFGARALLAAPLVWVATELGRTLLFTGFPWVLLGYSQAEVLPIAQLASLFGVYGVSALVASVSATAAHVVLSRPTSRGPSSKRTSSERAPYVVSGFSRTRRYAPAAATAGLVLIVAVWGGRRAAIAEWTRSGESIRVGLVQGNVDQAQKWDPARRASIFRDYLNLTRQVIDDGAALVLWPESSTPFLFEEDRDRADAEQVRALARQAGVSILIGSDQIEWRVVDNTRVPEKYFNAAFLVRADGSTAGVYRKMHLVPFGEYVPLQPLLFFAAPLTDQVGTFSPGVNPELLPVDGHLISTAICYEIVYPDLVRRFVTGGSELLTTITNDAWFGATSAPYQHFVQASMRAIEEGRYLIRSANTGISGIVDPYGRVLERTKIYETAVMVGEARLLRTTTLYARIGDVFAYASVVLTFALVLLARRRVR